MKKLCVLFAVIVFGLGLAYADEEVQFEAKKAKEFVSSAEYEQKANSVLESLNSLSPLIADFGHASQNTVFAGSQRNLERLLDVVTNIQEMMLTILSFCETDSTKTNELSAKLDMAYSYIFGPERKGVITINPVFERMGEVDFIIGYEDSTSETTGKPIKKPVKKTCRYVVTGGLKSTPQQDTAVIMTELLPDDKFKVAIGTLYSGQDKCTLNWLPGTHTSVAPLLQFYNANPEQVKYCSYK